MHMTTEQKWIIGDCIELMGSLNNIQMIVTSPPYFNSAKKYQRGTGVHYSKDVGEPLYLTVEMMEKAYPIIKQDGFVFLNLGFSYAETGVLRPFYIVQEIQKRTNWFCVDTIIWHKNNPIPIKERLTNAFEYIFVFAKHPISAYKKKITYEHNVWDFPVQRGNGHSAVFPLELPKKCIELGSLCGDFVLDPFAGSGTTLKACEILDRNGIGIDINPNYEYVAKKRLQTDNQKLEDWCSIKESA